MMTRPQKGGGSRFRKSKCEDSWPKEEIKKNTRKLATAVPPLITIFIIFNYARAAAAHRPPILAGEGGKAFPRGIGTCLRLARR